MVLNFPLSRALGLHKGLFSMENSTMTPDILFKKALEKKSYTDAIRLMSSVQSLQTKQNLISCAKSPELAFDILRLVPTSRQLKSIVETAAEDTRFARLIVEDIPEFRNDEMLAKAIDGDPAWAQKYKSAFGLSSTKVKSLLSKAQPQNKIEQLNEGIL